MDRVLARWALPLLVAAAAPACRIHDREASQQFQAHMLRPAAVGAAPGTTLPGPVRAFRLRAYASTSFRENDPAWAASIAAQVARANATLEPQFGIRLELEVVRAWGRPGSDEDLAEALVQLATVDPARGVDWVAGWVGPVPDRPQGTRREAVGYALAFGRHFVQRAMELPGDRDAIASWDALSEEERDALARDWREHLETSTFLHEWAHTLGAVHECPGKFVMSREYSLLESTFSPESQRLVRLGLDRRGATTSGELGAWAASYGAEGHRIRAHWECEDMERALARNERLLFGAAAAAAAQERARAAAGAAAVR